MGVEGLAQQVAGNPAVCRAVFVQRFWEPERAQGEAGRVSMARAQVQGQKLGVPTLALPLTARSLLCASVCLFANWR